MAVIVLLVAASPVMAWEYSQYALDAAMKLGATQSAVAVSGSVTDREIFRAWIDNPGSEDYFKSLLARFSFYHTVSAPFGGASCFPGTAADDASVGTVAWTNVNGVKVQDGNKAAASLAASATSHYLKATNFALAIPSNATIKGILTYVAGSQDSSLIYDYSVKLVVNGVISGDDRSTNSSLTGKNYGGQTDLWGNVLTPAIVNASNFGVVISAKDTATSGTYNAYVDYVQITVYYEVPVTWKWQIRCKPEGSWTDLYTAISENWGLSTAFSTLNVQFEAIKPNANKIPFELRLTMTKTSNDSVTVLFTNTSNIVWLVGGL